MAGLLTASTAILGAATLTSTQQNAAVLVLVFGIEAIALGVAVLVIVSLWKLFEKAGKPGWAAIIPIYNTWVMIEICGRPGWWLILMFIPFVSLVVALILLMDLAKMFGQSSAFGLGLLLLPFIFFPILAFGSARYIGYAGGGFPVIPGYAYPQYGNYPPGTFPPGYVPPNYPAGGYPPPGNPGSYPPPPNA